MIRFLFALVLGAALGGSGAVLAASSEEGAGGSAGSAYTPGLGEIMSAIQLHHAKLWFAGKARNWPLAAYELDEIQEGFDDAARFHPEHNGRPIASRIGPMTTKPMERLAKAIEERDSARFAAAYDELSHSCTSCHREAGYGFIRIQRPTIAPLTNQCFDLPSEPQGEGERMPDK